MDEHMEKQTAQSDHDLLIELKVLVKNLREEISRHNDNVVTMMNNHDGRLRKIEDLIIKTDPENKILRYDRVAEEWDNFKVSWKIWVTVAGGILTFVAAIVSRWVNAFIDRVLR